MRETRTRNPRPHGAARPRQRVIEARSLVETWLRARVRRSQPLDRSRAMGEPTDPPRESPVDAASAEPQPLPAKPVPAERAALRILVAEDNHINRKVMQAILRPLEAELAFAENGRDAVDAVGRTAYDIVLMDIEMPGMDGVSAANEIRRNGHTDVPILAITANAMKGDRERYLAAGLDGYVSKPIMPAELFAAIRGCVEERR